jgi:Tfp pilus assembly protein PilO
MMSDVNNSYVLDADTLRFGRLLHYAGLAVVLICGSVAYGWLYSPVETGIFETTMQIDELAISRRNAAAIRREHERLSSRLEDIGARYAALQRRVPLNAEAGSFLKDVSEIAHQEKLAISNFQPAKSVEGDGFTVMEVMLEGNGTFASICSFFDRLSKIKRLSKVKDLTVGVGPEPDGYPMKATIVIYFGLKGKPAGVAGQEVSRG